MQYYMWLYIVAIFPKVNDRSCAVILNKICNYISLIFVDRGMILH